MEAKTKKQKNPNVFRHWFQAAFFALTNGYASGFLHGKIYTGENKGLCVPGLNCYSCPGAFYACPIGSLQAVLNSRSFAVSCYVFGFILVVGAFFGRLVCGFLCPFGFVQDLLYKIPFFKKVKNLPGHRYLKYLRYVVLIVFVLLLSGLLVNDAGTGKPWYCAYICPSGTLFAGIPLVVANPGLQASLGWHFWLKIAILIVTLLLSILSFRPFCKYLCPLGALYGVCNPISLYRYRVDTAKCVSCGACQKACNMDLKVWEQPNSTECIRCGLCKSACPTGAITSTWDDWKLKRMKDLPKESMAAQAAGKKTRQGQICPAEKKNGVRTILGVVLLLFGMVVTAVLSYWSLITLIGGFAGTVDSRDAFNLLCMYGTMFLGVIAGFDLIKSGAMIVRNSGRYTASTRALRMLAWGILLLILIRVLNNFYLNTFTMVISAALWWSVLLVWAIIFASCLLDQKRLRNS